VTNFGLRDLFCPFIILLLCFFMLNAAATEKRHVMVFPKMSTTIGQQHDIRFRIKNAILPSNIFLFDTIFLLCPFIILLLCPFILNMPKLKRGTSWYFPSFR